MDRQATVSKSRPRALGRTDAYPCWRAGVLRITNYDLLQVHVVLPRAACLRNGYAAPPGYAGILKQERKAHLGSLWANCLVGRPILALQAGHEPAAVNDRS